MHAIVLQDKLEAIDFRKVTELLKTADWCKGITQAEVEFGAKNSALLVGAYLRDELVGYMRVVSDRVRFAYVMDVIVDHRYRRQGIGRGMVKYALEHSHLKMVYQWMLRTKDAQGVYAKLGFRQLVNPEQWMLIQNNRPKRDIFEPQG